MATHRTTVSFLTRSRRHFPTPEGRDGPNSSDHRDRKANNLDEYGPMAKVKNVHFWRVL
jgi:hypothetical protein